MSDRPTTTPGTVERDRKADGLFQVRPARNGPSALVDLEIDLKDCSNSATLRQMGPPGQSAGHLTT